MGVPVDFMPPRASLHVGMLDRSNEQTGTLLYPEGFLDSETTSLEDFFVVGGPYDLFKVALGAITKLNFTQTILSIRVDQSVATIPAAADAQREWYASFTYRDLTTNKLYRFSVPAPEDAIVQAGTDEIDMGNALIIAFTTIVEANFVSPTGNAIEVVSGRIGGRNS